MKKISTVFVSIMFFAFLFVVPRSVSATGITQILKKADIEFAKGNNIKASRLIRKALVYVYNKSQLAVDKSVLIVGNPKGFGMFRQRRNNVYKANETIIIYIEPVGYHLFKRGDTYRFGVVADFAIQNENGRILGGQNNFGSWGYATKGRPLFDFYMVLTYNFSGIKPGKYTIITTLHDKYGKSSTQIKTPIVVVR